MEPKFVGWVPNVAGRLSFSHIGQTRHPSPCRTLNEDDGARRLVICEQRRVLSDALVAAPYFKFVYGYDPTWRFILIAHSEADGEDRRARLTGNVFAFNSNRWENAIEGKEAGKTLFDALLPEAGSAIEAEETCAAFIQNRLPALLTSFSQACVFSTSCQLERDGTVRLALSGEIADVRYAPAVTVKASPIDNDARRYLCNQAYFFIKDISHTHRHHHSRADTITAAHEEDKNGAWIRETQYSMHRRVVALRRSTTPLTLYDALGLIAYMKSFGKVISKLTDTAGKAVAEEYNLEETEDSIRSKLEAQRWKRVQWNLILTAIPTLTLALTALLQKPDGGTTIFETFKAALIGIFSNDLRGIISLILILISVPWIYGTIQFTRLAPVYTAKRVISVWSPNRQILIWRIFGVISASALVGAATTTILGITSSLAVWMATFVVFASCAAGFVLLPYAFTLPDLIKVARYYPDRPNLSEP